MTGCKRGFLYSNLQEIMFIERNKYDVFNTFCEAIADTYIFH